MKAKHRTDVVLLIKKVKDIQVSMGKKYAKTFTSLVFVNFVLNLKSCAIIIDRL